MAEPVIAKSAFDKWKESVDRSKTDAQWNEYDADIKTAVGEFNVHLGKTTGYVALDWHLIKAMVWTESGPYAPEWKTRPMQIGNAGDPGLAALLGGKEGGELIMPPALTISLTTATASTPGMNIRAGIGYLLMRSTNYAFQDTPDVADTKFYEYTVKPGDSLDKIAKNQGTTAGLLKKSNPTAGNLIKPGQKLRYQKGAVKKVISGWKAINTATIASRYNTTLGDPNYSKKLDYCLSIMDKK
jgi:LysM repeat protein